MIGNRLTAFQHCSQRARIHHYVLSPTKILISDIRVAMKIEHPQTSGADLDIAPRFLENGPQRRPVVIEQGDQLVVGEITQGYSHHAGGLAGDEYD
jgi:hypothetical protein